MRVQQRCCWGIFSLKLCPWTFCWQSSRRRCRRHPPLPPPPPRHPYPLSSSPHSGCPPGGLAHCPGVRHHSNEKDLKQEYHSIKKDLKQPVKTPEGIYLHNLDGGRRGREEDVDILLEVNPALHGHQGNFHLNNNAC